METQAIHQAQFEFLDGAAEAGGLPKRLCFLKAGLRHKSHTFEAAPSQDCMFTLPGLRCAGRCVERCWQGCRGATAGLITYE